MEILILKTNIRNKKQVKTVAPLLNCQTGIARWNIDLMDIDRVLRIEATAIKMPNIIQLIQNAGFFCEELAG